MEIRTKARGNRYRFALSWRWKTKKPGRERDSVKKLRIRTEEFGCRDSWNNKKETIHADAETTFTIRLGGGEGYEAIRTNLPAG